MLLERGPRVSAQEIADRLEMSQAGLLKRFGSKKNLLIRALLPPGDPDWIRLIRAGPTAEPIENQLVEVFSSLIKFFRLVTPLLSVMRSSGINPAEVGRSLPQTPPVRDLRELTAWLDRCVEKGFLSQGNSPSLALIILSSFQTPSFLIHLGIPTTVLPAEDLYVNVLVDLILRRDRS